MSFELRGERPRYNNLHARERERDFQVMLSVPFRTEFATWMHQREQNIRVERYEQFLAKQREEWTEHMALTEVDDVPTEIRQQRLPMDNRALPSHAWQSIYHRFSRRHNFMLGRDQIGCDDLDRDGMLLRGTTIDIYNRLTGILYVQWTSVLMASQRP